MQNSDDVPGQPEWRYCNKCQGLFFGGSGTTGGTCPKDNKPHSANGSGNYTLAWVSHSNVQPEWRRCDKCEGLFFGGSPSKGTSGGTCPKDKKPHTADKENYVLALDSEDAPGQPGWRWCWKCQGLFFPGSTGGTCPTDDMAHSAEDSGDYVLVQNSNDAPGQPEWRYCNKCHGLFFGGSGSTGGTCPKDKKPHNSGGSGNYTLLV